MAERVRRSKDQIVADIEAKIAYHEGQANKIKETLAAKLAVHTKAIEKLNAKKEAVLNPKERAPRKKGVNAVIAMAKEKGMTAEEIAEKLGIEL